jgi:hypothetical protein
MERTVPTTESEEIDLYLRTYYSLLRSTAEVRIRTLEEVHAGMNSLLHPGARQPSPDMSALIYSLLRLPECMTQVKLVVMGQSPDVFAKAGFGDVTQWQEVSAQARRRRCYFDGRATLACLIASRSDIDDLIPLLTAFQIEWNKLHQLLGRLPAEVESMAESAAPMEYNRLAELLVMPVEDLDRLYAIWDRAFGATLRQVAQNRCDLRVQLLSGSLSEYRRATHSWWKHIEQAVPGMAERPVYFISSNIHSLLNLLGGYPLLTAPELLRFLEQPGNRGLLNEWNDIQAGRAPSNPENFLYYVFRKYQQTPEGRRSEQAQQAHERRLGLIRVPSLRSFDVEAQVFEIGRLAAASGAESEAITEATFDPRLRPMLAADGLAQSKALILNIDYPLGLAAYNILTEVAEHVGIVRGVYIMGKSASLNAVVGDVMIPNVVHDEHSQNTYLFPNCFTAADVAPYLVYGAVLDNQKAVTVKGTFLQNSDFMDVFYREGYTDIEMEAGPYLSAVYEMFRPQRHPVNEIVNLYGLPFDLGLLHYASDTPLNKGKNLGAGSLSYHGMDSTYAAALAVLQRIFHNELHQK